MRALVILGITLALAGCAAPSDPVEGAAASGADASAAAVDETAAAPDVANATTVAGGPAILYLLADGSLSAAPPTDEAAVPVDAIANTPLTGGSPDWIGTLPAGIDAGTTLTLRIFLTTSSVSIPARIVPAAFEWPGIGAYFTIGESFFELSAPGPDVLVRGDVTEIVITAPYPGEPVAAGSQMHVEIVPYYSHVQTVADVEFVMGPDHLAALVFEPAPSAS